MKKINIGKEILIIGTVLFGFMTAACINKSATIQEHRFAYTVTICADLILLTGWVWNWICKWLNMRKSGKSISVFFADSRGILITLLFCFLSRAAQLSDTPRWDAAQYYKMLKDACQNFDFTLQSFLQCFSLFNHPTLGFAGLTAIGEFLMPSIYKGVLIIWLIITLITAYCLYKILEKLLPTCSWIYHSIAACVAMSTPLVLGTFFYYQPDAGTVCFFVFTIYCYLYRKNLLMLFSMLLLIQTKEIGIVILGGFAMGALLGRIIYTGKEKNAFKRLTGFFKEPLGICCILAALLLGTYFIIFLHNGGSIWSISGSSEDFSTFSFQPAFILFKWKQFFILNFNWVIWGGNLILFITGKIRHYKKKRPYSKLRRKDIVLAIFMTAFFQMIFYCSYITYTLPRYHVLIDYCGVFLFVILIGRNFPKGNIRYVTSGFIGILLLTEAYTTIDPLSLCTFQNAETGNGRIIYEDYNKGNIQGDFCVYNHQINYLGMAYEHILRDVGYHSGMDVLVWNLAYNYAINGEYYWDTQSKNLSLINNQDSISIRVLEHEIIEKNEEKLQKEAVFILAPQFTIDEEHAEQFLNNYYEIRYKGNVEIPWGGKLTFYVCDLTDFERLME